MNWMEALLRTYDMCIEDPETMIGSTPLLPICHTTNLVQIEITLGPNGNFLNAEALPKERQMTVIPCSEKSGGRTSGLAPHPLSDKLQYLASDYTDRLILTDDKKGKKIISGYDSYLEQLNNWCSSKYCNEKISIVKKYVESRTILSDLISCGVLVANEDGKILNRDSSVESPLYSISKMIGNQLDAFVRWRVDIPADNVKDTWKDKTIYDSWIGYYLSTKGNRGLCYISGKEETLANTHPSKIRNSGDKAKLISSNDKNGFAFRGRFETSDQACGIGYETTQKVHNVLRWLINRQGYREGDLCIVSWTIPGDEIKSPVDDYSALFELNDEHHALTNVEAAKHLNNRIRGYNSKILNKNVMILVMNSATPGRLSLLTYREKSADDFINKLESWHSSCAWIHRYATKEVNGKRAKMTFIGAPTPKDIAKAAYSDKTDVKTIAHTVQRILPCILDNDKIPKDIVDSTVRRASNPLSMENWEWMKTLSVACSVYKQWSGGNIEMTLDTKRKTRDYLYGRLLAIADLLEGEALRNAGEMRQTTAIRMMQRFSEFPYSTWRDIELALIPYMARLGIKSKYYEMKIADIMDLFDTKDFTNNSKLNGEFLLAYHSEKEEHFRKKEAPRKIED